MSAIVDCPACSNGRHEGHDAKHGVRPGLLGGAECNCSGDCADRHDAATERLLRAIFGASTVPASTTDRENP